MADEKKMFKTRTLDDLGRISIPEEYRNLLKLVKESKVQVSMDGNKIILEKNGETCPTCGC